MATTRTTKTTAELLEERRREIESRLKRLDETDERAIRAAEKRDEERTTLLAELRQIPGTQEDRGSIGSLLKGGVKTVADRGTTLITWSKSLSAGLLGALVGILVGIAIAIILGVIFPLSGGVVIAVWILAIVAGASLGFVITTRPKSVTSTP